MEYKKSIGGIVSRLPFGYTKHNDIATVNNDQAYTIRAIFRMLNRGFSYDEVARYLQTGDVPPTNGRKWSKSSVYEIAHNPRYAGYEVRGGIYIQSSMPAIVEKELFEYINGPISAKMIHR